MLLNLFNFTGVNPRQSKTAGRYKYATLAHNLHVDDGAIHPLEADVQVYQGSGKLSWCGCEITRVDPCTLVTSYFDKGCERKVIAIPGEEPYFMDCSGDCSPTPVRLTPPAGGTLEPSVAGEINRSVDEVAYAITYETCFCDESRPSYPSLNVSKLADGSNEVSGIPIPPSYVSKVHVYRTQTAYRSGTEEVQESVTEWYHIGAINPGQTSIVDEAGLPGPIMRTRTHHPLEENVCQVQVIPNSRLLVGYKGNRLLFSEDGEPSNWHYKSELTFDSKIACIAANVNFITVLTIDGSCYTVDVSICADTGCRPVAHNPLMAKHLPSTCCGAGKATPIGNIIPTLDGLFVYDQNGGATNITAAFFSTSDWRRIATESLIFAEHKNVLYFTVPDRYATEERITYRLPLTNNAQLTTLDMPAVWYQHTPTGELIYGTVDAVYHAFGTSEYRHWEYQQDLYTDTVGNAALVSADACDTFHMSLTAGSCSTQTQVPDYSITCLSQKVRLQRRIKLELKGNDCVRNIRLASSKFMLGARA